MHAYGMGERMMHIEKFTEYLAREKKMAKNSLDAYRRDVKEFADFEAARGISDLTESSSTEVVAFLHNLRHEGKSGATINRKLASVRAFYNYLSMEKLADSNPTAGIRTPRVEKKEIEFITI